MNDPIHTNFYQEKFDYEVKYIGDNAKAKILESYLDQHFMPDPDYPSAIISSIYFDTFNFNFLHEKINSDFEKTKIRIRSYLDLISKEPVKQSFMEIKHKLGDKRFKTREQIITNRFYDLALNSNQFFQLANNFKLINSNIKESIFPAFSIQYERKRYIVKEQNVRICLDKNIFVPKFNKNFFHRAQKGFNQNCVFEIKGHVRKMPIKLDILEKMDYKLSSYSKYLACFAELMK